MSKDLVIIEELARIYIRDELGVPDARSLHQTRDRLAPWDPLLPAASLDFLRSGQSADVSRLDSQSVSVGLWPDGPIPGLERMTMHVDAVDGGIVRTVLINERKTILLVFFLDYKSGRIHTNLENGGLFSGEQEPDETDVRAYATFFYKVFGNGVAELRCGDLEPVDCEIVIPVNMMMTKSPDEAIADSVEAFRLRLGCPIQGQGSRDR
ncbi:hypothetical protein [Bradyrhizobium arachidis]|nr:hypothetical protein [Bradyrhizobium arachidis]